MAAERRWLAPSPSSREAARMSPGRVAARWAFSRALPLLWIACGAHDGARPPVPGRPARAKDAIVARPAAEPREKSKPGDEPLVLIRDRALLAALEARGLSFGDFVLGPGSGVVSNRALAASARYRTVVETLTADIERLRAGDPAAGVGVARFSHRLFDHRWFYDDAVRFELVAVANRADRAPFRPQSCGETRLVYRLSYRRAVATGAQPGTTPAVERVSSRLPLTASLELPAAVSVEACAAFAERWQAPSGLPAAALAEWLTGEHGPLAPARLARALPAQRLAVNLQGVRWPSTVRPDLGGHAEYVLRVFELDGAGGYVAAALENTPDGERLRRDAPARAALLKWIREPNQLAAIDAGTAVLPSEFLARRALSVTPRGLSRLSNRPFSALYSSREFEGLDLSELRFARSPAGLLRRLDALSCPGCHGARSVAGFHLLGEDAEDGLPANALESGLSPHVAADLSRRRAVVTALSAGGTPDFSQPFPERGDYDGYGAHCGLGSDPTFVSWTCAPGLSCRAYDGPAGDEVGQCLPASPGAAGDACETGPLSAKADPRRDRVQRVDRSQCNERAVCNGNAVGFPGGMCAESCSALSPDAACGAIAVLEPFNACLGRGEPFARCLGAHVRPAGLRACGSDRPCRDDYVCAQGAGSGVCIPPYFLFQLRVDGHR
jgi:hypothetical protein